MGIKIADHSDELSFELSVIRQGFDDILECARKYTYYVVDKRTPVFIWYGDYIVGLQLPIRKVL